MPPAELSDALMVADILNGELPHWLRDPEPDAQVASPLGPEFEEALETAKRGETHPLFAAYEPKRRRKRDA